MEDEFTFNEYIDEMGYSEHSDEVEVGFMRDAWNAAIISACRRFRSCEGTDHGTEEELTV